MTTNNNSRTSAAYPLGEVSQLLTALEEQKDELGPIADELIELFHRMGVSGAPEPSAGINPSNG